MMYQTRGVCFDLFHTLVDVGSAPGDNGASTADILGVSRDRWRAACFGTHHEIRQPTDSLGVVKELAHSIDPSIPMVRIKHAADARNQRFAHALRSVPPSVLSLLDALRGNGLRLGLISNASSGEVSAWQQSPLAARFDAAVFSCDCGFAKPEEAIYIHALEQMAVEAKECIYVGDGGSDEHLGARLIGMRTAMVTTYIRDRLSEAELARRRALVDVTIDGLDQVLDLLDGCGAP